MILKRTGPRTDVPYFASFVSKAWAHGHAPPIRGYMNGVAETGRQAAEKILAIMD